MRILAIRGENLASLAGPFEIDLTAEPLAGTGLFAITGPTGAGKSTILDAMCLALYGRFPRASGGRDERVPDEGEETLSASDPRTILRRQAASCFAEVDVIGADGIGYRARWSVRRARARAGGTLQKPSHTLGRLDDGSAVAVGLKDVSVAVLQRTGLGYDQFRRTVLLAQGEFDALLLADEAARADLLERITGTAIYTRISIEAFRATAEKAAALDVMVARRAAVPLLAPEDREALTSAEAAAALGLDRAKADVARLDAIVRHGEAVAAARAALAEAERSLERARARFEDGAPTRERLARLARVEPLRARIDRIGDLERAVAAARAAAETAILDAERADAAADDARRREEVQTALVATLAADVERLTPLWEEAARLDMGLAAAHAEEDRARSIAERAAMVHAEAVAGADVAKRRRDETEANLDGVRRRLRSVADHERLATEWERIDAALGRHRRLNADLGAALVRREALDRSLADADRTIAALQHGLATSAARRAGLARALDDRRARLAELDPQALATRELRLGAAEHLLAVTEAEAERHAVASSGLIAARDAAASAAAARVATTADLARIGAALAHDRRALEDVQPLADLAEATLSAQAVRLRATLAAGAPCPVCGATDHPWHGDAAAHALAAEVRTRRQDLARRVGDGERVLRQRTADEARAEAARSEAERRAEAEHATLTAAHGRLRTLVPSLTAALTTAGLALPAALRATIVDPLAYRHHDRIGDALTVTRAALTEQRAGLRQIRSEADDLAAAIARDHAALDDIDRVSDVDRGRLALAERERAGHSTEHAALGTTVRHLAADLEAVEFDLAPALVAAGLAVPLRDALNGPDDVGDQLRARAEQWRRLDREHRALAERLPALTVAVDAAEARLAAATDALDGARSAFEDRRCVRTDLEAARARLLDGAPTGPHRAAALVRLAEAQAAASAAVGVTTTASRTAIDRRAERAARTRALDAATTALADDRAVLDRDLGRLGMTREAADALLTLPADARLALADAVATLDREVAAAVALVGTRQGDLDTLVANAPARPSDEQAQDVVMRSELAARRLDAERLAEHRASLRRDLETDAARRAGVADLDREIETARADLAVWRAVNEAIGQADGARFRRVAQGVTLRHLVALANGQLRALDPRYRLRVGTATPLALEIVDADMGDEVRGPRSLSGGERFLVSLALALALARLDGGQAFVDTLFIDEGFGALDRETLDMAVTTLETLHGQGRKVGVVTHAQAMIERIPVHIHVAKRGNGRSSIAIRAPG